MPQNYKRNWNRKSIQKLIHYCVSIYDSGYKLYVYLWCQKLDRTVGRMIPYLSLYIYLCSTCKLFWKNFLTSWYDAWSMTYIFYICTYVIWKVFLKKHHPYENFPCNFLDDIWRNVGTWCEKKLYHNNSQCQLLKVKISL